MCSNTKQLPVVTSAWGLHLAKVAETDWVGLVGQYEEVQTRLKFLPLILIHGGVYEFPNI